MGRRSVFSRLVVLFVLVSFAGALAAQELQPVPSLSLDGLDRHLDRADRATDVSSWLAEAERGLGAVAAWEQARARERLTDRLVRFLDGQLEGELPAVGTQGALFHLDFLDRTYLYESADDSIAVDSAGDPLLRGAEGATEDHAAWSATVRRRRGELVDAWALEARVAYDEILAHLDGEYRAVVAPELSATLDEYVARAEREFERLAVQSESRLLRGRLRDTYSRRRKSEGESAGAIAAGLVTSTEEKLTSAGQVLQATTEALVTEPDIASLDAWEESYKEAFQAGLDAWSRAEGRLLEERLAWETASQEAFIEAEAAWDAAFADLDTARTAWLGSMQELIENGRAAWDALELVYDEELSRSVSDLAAAAAEEQTKIRREVDAYLGAYNQALGILALAEKNTSYLGQELENTRRVLESEIESRDTETRETQLAGINRRIDELEPEVAFLAGEHAYWNDLSTTYHATAQSVAETIAGLGTGYVADFAGGSINARDRELARLDRQIALLAHQRDIAEAVVDYARDRSSGRATEADTAERLRWAQAAYVEADAAYLVQIDTLETITDDMAGYQSLLEDAQGDLEEVTTEYQAKKETYDSLWLSWVAQDTTTLQRAVEGLDDDIEAFYRTDRPGLYKDYFLAAEASIRADIAAQAEAVLEELPDLAEAADRLAAIDSVEVIPEGAPPSEPKTREELATEYLAAGLSLGDPELEALLEAYDAASEGGAGPGGAAWDSVVAAHEALIARVTHEYELLAETVSFLEQQEMTEEEYRLALDGPLGEVYSEYAEFAPSRTAAVRAEAAQSLAELLGRSEEDADTLTFSAIDAISSTGEALELFALLAGTGELPAYLAAVTREYLAAHLAPLGLEAVEERGELGAELDATMEALELADEAGASLAAAAKLYIALSGLSIGGDPEREAERAEEIRTTERFLLSELTLYVDRRAEELGDDSPEGRATMAVQGLEAVGLPGDFFGADDIDALRGTVDLGGSDTSPALFDSATEILTGHYVRLSAERRAVRYLAMTVERAEELSGRPELASDEVAAFRALLARGLKVMGDEDWDEAAGETAVDAAGAALNTRIRQHRQAFAERGELQEALTLGSTGRRAYFTSTVQPAKEALEEATTALTDARSSYRRLLDEFEALSSSYAADRGLLDTLYRDYTAARRELQLAEELSDYAAHGYELETQSPTDVLAGRQAELGRVSRIREIVAALEVDPDVVGPTDELYRNHAARQASLREAKSYLLYASEEFEKQIGAAAAELNRVRSDLTGAAYDLFRLPEGIPFDPDFGTISELTLFDDTDPGTLMADLSSYFAFDAADPEDVHRVAQRYSTDIARWISGVAAHGGSALLRDFGLAMHRERPRYASEAPDAPAIPIEIEANQVYNRILGHSRIGSIDTTSVRNLIKARGDEALGRIGADEETQALYGFFRGMFLSGNLTLDTSYISYDTSAIAREEARYRARRAYEFYNGRGKRMWRGRLRRRIRGLYEDLPNYNGSGPRGGIARTIGSFETTLLDVNIAQADFDRLSGAADGLVSEDALREAVMALGDARGEAPPGTRGEPTAAFEAAREEALAYIEGAVGILTASERASTFHAVGGLLREVERDLAATEDAMNRRLSVLADSRAGDQAAYDYLTSEGNLDETALRSVAEALFANPAFSPDSLLESQVAAAETVSVFNQAGAGERMGYRVEVLGRLGSYSVSLGADDEVQRLSADRAELAARRNNWEATVVDLHRTGLREFRSAFARLAQERTRWRDDFRADYLARSAMWGQKYQLFQAEREHWAIDAAAVTVSGTSARLARQLGLSAESLIAGIEDIDIPALTFDNRSIDRVIARSLDGRLLTGILDYAARLASRASTRRPAIAASLPSVRSPGDAGRLALGMSADIADEIHAKAATVAALQLRESLDRMRVRIDEQIADANQSVERNFTITLRSAGYTRSGSAYRRRAIIDESLLGGIERETHRIGAYRYFDEPTFFLTSDITASALSGLPGTLVEARIEEAQEEMQTYLTLIFGRSEKQRGEDAMSLEELAARLDESLVTRLSAETARFARSAQFHKNKDTEGLFNLHLGYAPVMKDSDPEKVKTAGYGESGRIMEEFFRNEARLGRGLATLETAWYDLKLYDDDKNNDGKSDGLIGAPTTRGVASIAASIAAGALTGGAGLGLMGTALATTAVSMTDDIAFAITDVSGGRMSWEQAGSTLGRQAAIGVGTSMIGGGFDGLSDVQLGGTAVGETFAGYTALQGGEILSTNAFSGSVNALSWDGSGLNFDTDRLGDTMFGAHMVGRYVGAGVDAVARGSIDGLSQSDQGNLAAVSGFLGGSAEAATNYLTTGTTTANLLNSNLFWQDSSAGMVELSIGGGATQLRLEEGGVDMSYRRLAGALHGRDAFRTNNRIRSYQALGRTDFSETYDGNRRVGTALRGVYSYGDATGRGTLDRILSGEDSVRVGYIDHTAETNRSGDSRTIDLSTLGSRGSFSERMRAGVVLQHEAHRDGLDGGTYLQNVETIRSVLSHSGMAARIAEEHEHIWREDKQLHAEVRNYHLAQRSGSFDELAAYAMATYDSSRDYWRILESGDLVFDGKKDLYDENDELLRRFEGEGGYTAALAEHLGISEWEANSLLVAAGFSRFQNGTFVASDGTDVFDNEAFAIDPGADFAARYFIQREFVDRVGDYGGSMVAAATEAQQMATDVYTLAMRSNTMTEEIRAQYEAANALSEFAAVYDGTLHGERYGSFAIPGLMNTEAAAAYDAAALSAALNVVAQNLSRTDDHPMYQHILDGTFSPLLGTDGSVGPTVGSERSPLIDTYITARTLYNDGTPHAWYRDGEPSLSVDLGTHLLPVGAVLFAESTVLAQGTPFGWRDSSGGFAQFDVGPLDVRYVHLADSWQQKRSRELQDAAMAKNLFRYSLPAGYSLGPLFDGPMPASDGTHLHLEFIYR